eukprot:GHVT01059194.1.p1 GENE.GHVT01059194.1~~GHVT01059194.1.p1  ORF type:complete len:326 (-),score=7.23 GHVT01059194.1:2582-3559(-)
MIFSKDLSPPHNKMNRRLGCHLGRLVRLAIVWKNTRRIGAMQSMRRAVIRGNLTGSIGCILPAKTLLPGVLSLSETRQFPKRYGPHGGNLLDKSLWWRTTDANVVDYVFSDRDVQDVERWHRNIILDPRITICSLSLDTSLPHNTESSFCTTALKSLKSLLLRPPSYIPNRYLQLIISQATNSSLLLAFKIDDFNTRVFFLVLHVWMFHRLLITREEFGLASEFWKEVWKYYEFLLFQERCSEFKLQSNLESWQTYTHGFCVALDEALDNYPHRWAGQLRYVLFMHFFGADASFRESSILDDITVYTLRTVKTVSKTFRPAAFVI